MANGTAQQYIKIPKAEYDRLLSLVEEYEAIKQHRQGITEAREDVKAGRTKPQEEVFAELGL